MIFTFIKSIKISQKPKSSQKHHYNFIHELNIKSSNNIINVIQNKINVNQNYIIQSSFKNKKQYKKQIVKTVGNVGNGHYKHRSSILKFTTTENNNWYANKTKLKKKVQNQRQLFKKYNYLLTKYYLPINNNIKGIYQIFSMFMKCLFQVKVTITTHLSDIISNKSQGKQRFMYQIKQMNIINDKILNFYHTIGYHHKSSLKRIKQLQKTHTQTIAQLKSEHRDDELLINEFIKKLTLMIELTKIVLNIPEINNIIIDRIKIFQQVLQLLSYFRFYGKYLIVQILNINKNISNNHEDYQDILGDHDYQSKWKKMFQKKYKPMRINPKAL